MHYILKKSVCQIVSSLQFKQSSLLAGYYNKNLQKQRHCAMHCCFISKLFRGLLYCVTAIQECSHFHSKRNPYLTWRNSQQKPERKSNKPSNPLSASFLGRLPRLYYQSMHTFRCRSSHFVLFPRPLNASLFFGKRQDTEKNTQNLVYIQLELKSQFPTL